MFNNLTKADMKFDDLSFDEFKAKLKGQINYGLNTLDDHARDAMIEKGRKVCEYFEETVLHLWYEQYKKQQDPFNKFCFFTLFLKGLLNQNCSVWADCKETYDKVMQEVEHAQ